MMKEEWEVKKYERKRRLEDQNDNLVFTPDDPSLFSLFLWVSSPPCEH